MASNHQRGETRSLPLAGKQQQLHSAITSSSASSSGNDETPLTRQKYPAAVVSASAAVSGSTAATTSASALASFGVVQAPPHAFGGFANTSSASCSAISAGSGNESSSMYSFGLDEMLLARADSSRQQQKAFSSRAHRKLMGTLYRALRGTHSWRVISYSYVAALLCAGAYTCFLVGCFQELGMRRHHRVIHRDHDEPLDQSQVLVSCNHALLVGAVLFCLGHLIWYFEVINSCENLEVWLEEYFYGSKPLMRRQFCGFFPTHIEFWAALLPLVGSLLFASARVFIQLQTWRPNRVQDEDHMDDDPWAHDFGLVHANQSQMLVLVWYWLPVCLGSFLMLIGAYLGYIEVLHGWAAWRCHWPSLECWVTGLYLLASGGIFLTSALQFMDPSTILLEFQLCLLPFIIGSLCGLGACLLSVYELEKLHKPQAHPDFGVIQRALHSNQYGT